MYRVENQRPDLKEVAPHPTWADHVSQVIYLWGWWRFGRHGWKLGLVELARLIGLVVLVGCMQFVGLLGFVRLIGFAWLEGMVGSTITMNTGLLEWV